MTRRRESRGRGREGGDRGSGGLTRGPGIEWRPRGCTGAEPRRAVWTPARSRDDRQTPAEGPAVVAGRRYAGRSLADMDGPLRVGQQGDQEKERPSFRDRRPYLLVADVDGPSRSCGPTRCGRWNRRDLLSLPTLSAWLIVISVVILPILQLNCCSS
jgi:hypothetical protein